MIGLEGAVNAITLHVSLVVFDVHVEENFEILTLFVTFHQKRLSDVWLILVLLVDQNLDMDIFDSGALDARQKHLEPNGFSHIDLSSIN